jgi:hypothetical protein
VQHHYYRYLVVTPGGQLTAGMNQDDRNAAAELHPPLPTVSTFHESIGSIPVAEWEDPFGVLTGGGPSGTTTAPRLPGTPGSQLNPEVSTMEAQPMGGHGNLHNTSGISLSSASVLFGPNVIGSTSANFFPTKQTFRNLPFRTVDIDTHSGTILYNDPEESTRMDRFNEGEDATFQPYLIREAVRSFHDFVSCDVLISGSYIT